MAFEPLTFEELLELWRQLFPLGYTFPIENEFDGQGLDVFAQQAQQFADAGEAIAVTQQVYYKLPHSTQIRPQAMGGQKASGEVLLSRDGSTLGEINLDFGTVVSAIVQDTRGNLIRIGEFILLSGATLVPGMPGPISVPAECTRVGYQGNVPAGSISAFKELGRASVVADSVGGNFFVDNGLPDRFTENMIGRYVVFTGGPNLLTTPRKIITSALGEVTLDGPPLAVGVGQQLDVVEYADLGLIVSQPDDFAGGRHAWLDAIAAERDIYRQEGETDEQLVMRVCFLADTISPGAVERLCHRILGACGICCEIVERASPEVAMIWDLPVSLAPDIMSPWDEPSTTWDSLGTQSRFLQITVSCGNAGEIGFAYDADPMGPVDDNAWDWPDLGPQLSPPVWDGFPAGYNACIASFVDALNNVLAAGVGYEIVKDCSLECQCVPAP